MGQLGEGEVAAGDLVDEPRKGLEEGPVEVGNFDRHVLCLHYELPGG